MTVDELRIELEKYPGNTIIRRGDDTYEDVRANEVRPFYTKDELKKLLYIVID